MYRSREWVFERIRRDRRLDPAVSGRVLAQRYKGSRNTVAKALSCPVPARRKKLPPRKSVLEPVKGFIDAMLREDLEVWRKQKHTIDRILERLAGEHDFELAAYSTVRDYVAKRRPELALAKEGRRPLLGPLPADGYDCGIDLTPVVARNGRGTVRQCHYSVPAKFIGAKVRVKLRANELWVFDGRHVVARHPRLTRRYAYHDILDHYLEILLVKPGAFGGAAALVQARAEGGFTKVHEAFWAAAKTKAGQRRAPGY